MYIAWVETFCNIHPRLIAITKNSCLRDIKNIDVIDMAIDIYDSGPILRSCNGSRIEYRSKHFLRRIGGDKPGAPIGFNIRKFSWFCIRESEIFLQRSAPRNLQNIKESYQLTSWRYSTVPNRNNEKIFGYISRNWDRWHICRFTTIWAFKSKIIYPNEGSQLPLLRVGGNFRLLFRIASGDSGGQKCKEKQDENPPFQRMFFFIASAGLVGAGLWIGMFFTTSKRIYWLPIGLLVASCGWLSIVFQNVMLSLFTGNASAFSQSPRSP
jgi:hypothetical protein